MSALGHERTFRSALAMSALPPKADIEFRKLARRRKLIGGPPALQACEDRPGPAANLFAFVRAWPDAIVCSLRVHYPVTVILHSASDLLDAIKLINAGGKRIRNRFFGSHFKVISV